MPNLFQFITLSLLTLTSSSVHCHSSAVAGYGTMFNLLLRAWHFLRSHVERPLHPSVNKNVPIANTSRQAAAQQRTTEPPGTWLYPHLFCISLFLNFPAVALRCRPCRRCPPSPGGAAGGSALPAAGGNSGPPRGSVRRTSAPRAGSRGDGAEVGQRLVCWIWP